MCDECKATCSNCGRQMKFMRRGMCKACYLKWLHSDEAQNVRGWSSVFQYERKCTACGTIYGKGGGVAQLCNRCYWYKKSRGVDWTPERGKRRASVPPPICSICKARQSYYTKPVHMCFRCNAYYRRHGMHRPKRFDAEKCKVCGRERVYDKRNSFIMGRCRTCYDYWYRHDKVEERPERLWDKGKYGYCDCGKPATHKAQVQVHRHQEELPLCDECYAIEQQHTAWYGDGKPTGNLQQGKRLDLYGDD